MTSKRRKSAHLPTTDPYSLLGVKFLFHTFAYATEEKRTMKKKPSNKAIGRLGSLWQPCIHIDFFVYEIYFIRITKQRTKLQVLINTFFR